MPNKCWLIWVLNLLVFHSVASGKANEPTLKIVIMAEFEALNPLFARLPGSKYILGFTSRPLMHADSSGKLVSDLLESVPEDHAPPYAKLEKKRTLSLKLKSQLFWADGSELTAEDIVYTLSIAKHFQSSIPNGSIYKKIDQINISPEDSKRINVLFSSSDPHLVQQLVNFRIIPKPSAKGSAISSKPPFDPLNPRNYNGPYFVSSFQQGKSISLSRNKYFKENPSNIDKIDISLHFHHGVIEDKVLNEGFDLLPSPGFKHDFAKRLKNVLLSKQSYTLLSANSSKSVQMILSTQFEALNNHRIRKALRTSLPAYTTSLYDITKPSNQPSSAYNTDLALGLFQEAGWLLKNKTLRNKNGKKFELELAITNTPRELRDLAEHIQLNWEQIGVKVRIKTLKRNKFLTKALSKKQKTPTVPLFILQAGPIHERSRLRQLLAGNFNFDDWKYMQNVQGAKHNPLNKSFIIDSRSFKNKVLDHLMREHLEHETVFLKLFNLPKAALASHRLIGIKFQDSSFPESYHSTFWKLSD